MRRNERMRKETEEYFIPSPPQNRNPSYLQSFRANSTLTFPPHRLIVFPPSSSFSTIKKQRGGCRVSLSPEASFSGRGASCFLSLEMQRGSVNDDSRRGLDRYPFSPLRWDRQPKCPDPPSLYPCTRAMQPPGLRRKHFSKLSPSAPPPFPARGHISFVSPGGNRRKKTPFYAYT